MSANHIAIDIWPEPSTVQTLRERRPHQLPLHNAPLLQGPLRSPLPVQYDPEAKWTPPQSPTQQVIASLFSWFLK